jgi:transposase
MIRVSDSEWERIRDHFPEENIPDGRPGRKPTPTRPVFEAALWILNTGAQWHMLPQCFPNYKTVHRRFQTWCQNEVLRRVLIDIANELRERGGLDEEECFIDATFVMAKGGGAEVAPTKRGKGTENHSDSAASFKPDEATDAGPTAPKPILPALAGRALFCLDPMATSHPRALGIVI